MALAGITDMDQRQERHDEETEPQAKRTGREAANPKSQPEEFLNDLEVNRSEERPARDDQKAD
jgi:hypothetical protein